MATEIQRNHIVGLCSWLVSSRSFIGYNQFRPMQTRSLHEIDLYNTFVNRSRIHPDCSEFVTMVCRMAGLKDPNGMNYDGFGNTDTMAAHLPHYTDSRRAHPGALVIFGPIPGSVHVAIVVGAGSDPFICSHGSEQGPILIKLSAYTAAEPQQRPVTFLDVGQL